MNLIERIKAHWKRARWASESFMSQAQENKKKKRGDKHGKE